MSKCECEPSDLLLKERQYSRCSDTSGFVWCAEHRVWVQFTAPKEAFDTRIAVGPAEAD
jgi:hypothetical protein